MSGEADTPAAAARSRRPAAAPRPSEQTTAEQTVTGLTAAEVRERVAAGQVNVTARPGGRTTWDIVRGNLFTCFNLILGILFVVMLIFGSCKDALFGWIIFINAGIGIVQEMRAKIALDQLSLLTAPVAKVVRDGVEQQIPIDEVVLDDVMVVAAGDQIVADGEAIDSKSLEVDESLLTGESVPDHQGGRRQVAVGQLRGGGQRHVPDDRGGPRLVRATLTREGKHYTRLHSDLVAGINSVLRVIGIGDPAGGRDPRSGRSSAWAPPWRRA